MQPEHRIPTHPGEILREEFLAPLGQTQVALAEHLRVPVQRINELVRGKRGVTRSGPEPAGAEGGPAAERLLARELAAEHAALAAVGRTRDASGPWYGRGLDPSVSTWLRGSVRS